jgi:hypothetical protein
MAGGDALGDVRLITDFAGGTLTPERALSAAPLAGDAYEIHDRFSAHEIHSAIDRALFEARNAFFDVVTDETLILEEDKLIYDLTGLSVSPWIILKIWLERNSTAMQGEVDSATSTTITDNDGDFSDVDSNWKIGIYSGTGTGQLRDVASVSDQTITVSAAWTTTPDDTSGYTLWDPTDQEWDWYRLRAVRFDQKEYPSYLYLTRRYSSLYGLRIRLQYLAHPSALTSDTATTVVPEEYIVHKALATLYRSRAGDNRVDRQKYLLLADYHDELATKYKSENAFSIPEGTLWEAKDLTWDSSTHPVTSENPLDW